MEERESDPEPVRISAPGAKAAKVLPIAARQPEVKAEPRYEQEITSREVSRAEIVKGFEYAKDRYVTLTKEELAAITPQTAREMQILEFVPLSAVDPIYFESTYYLGPEKQGEKAYQLLAHAMEEMERVALATGSVAVGGWSSLNSSGAQAWRRCQVR